MSYTVKKLRPSAVTPGMTYIRAGRVGTDLEGLRSGWRTITDVTVVPATNTFRKHYRITSVSADSAFEYTMPFWSEDRVHVVHMEEK